MIPWTRWKSIIPALFSVILFVCIYSVPVCAQGIAIGENSSVTPHNTALLHLQSTAKGFLLPRMTTTQRNAISSPAEGLQIYNTTTHCFEIYNGTTWRSLCGCTSAPSASISVPSASFSVVTAASFTVTANTPTNAGGLWQSVPAATFANPISPSTTFTGSAGQSYTLTWLTFNSCGAAFDSKDVRILQIPASTIFVDQTTGNDSYSGAYATPVATITVGISKAQALAYSQVIVCAGVYNEAVTLAAGIDLLGGYDYTTLVRDPALYETVIRQPGNPLSIQSITSQTIVNGFTLEATSGSFSTYCVYMKNSQNIEIRDCLMRASDASDGTAGTNGTAGSSGPHGSNGTGATSCINGGTASSCGSCSQPLGGSGGSTGWGSGGGNGGYGGLGTTASGPGASGSPGALGGPGGGAASSGCFQQGNDGANGAQGSNGAQGAAGASLGSMAASGYVPSGGSGGTSGQHGGGGGGGSGQGGGQKDSFTNAFYCNGGAPGTYCNYYGASGGGGGAGGQGGGAGTAGSGGSGSFGVWLYASTSIIIDNCEIFTGRGGYGGAAGIGGNGGDGGSGGSNAQGGDSAINFFNISGAGGDGGNGGDGGHGGGGGGGPSIGIMKSATSTVTLSNITYHVGTAGQGGQSYGNSGSNGTAASKNF